MKGGFGLYIVGAGVLLALVGCGRSFLSGERAPWRHDAEVACMKSGSVKIGASVVQVDPIEGPGMCGADFPLKVAALGESSSLVGYADDLRPPGSIPNGSAQMPRWPINEPQYAPPATVPSVQSAPARRGCVGCPDHHRRKITDMPRPPDNRFRSARLVPHPPRRSVCRKTRFRCQTIFQTMPSCRAIVRRPTYTPRTYGAPAYQTPQRSYETPANQPQQRSYQAPVYQTPQRSLPPLGPARRPTIAHGRTRDTHATRDAGVSDRLGTRSVGQRWRAACSNALVRRTRHGDQADLRLFVSRHGRRRQVPAFPNTRSATRSISPLSPCLTAVAITVQDGWHGTPEEQGFLRDVHLAACNHFSTVLAPGYNAAHYNHIHVDLMRRASGDRPCRPEAMTGEVAAAKARAAYASRQRGPAYTGVARTNTRTTRFPTAIPGEDGLDDILIDMQSHRGPARHNITGAVTPASAPTLVR